MREGYKVSPLGIIPEIWKTVELQSVCIPKSGMRRGPFGGAIKKAFFVSDGYHVYEQRNAIYDDFTSVRYYINEEKFKELKAFQIQANDFIVSCSGTIGKIAKVPIIFNKGVINQALLRIRLNRELILDNYFLHQFRSEPFQNKITDSTQGGAMKNLVGMVDFRKTLIPLPPLPEQQKIAEILSTVDAKIEIIDQQISEISELKKGLMQRLLTKGIGHTKFKDSVLGEIPESWEVVKLGKLGNFFKGRGISKSEILSEGEFPCLRYGEIYTIYDTIIYEFKSYINQASADKSVSFNSGDLLFTGSGETIGDIGKCVTYIGNDKPYAGGDLIIHRPTKGDSKYLSYYMNSVMINEQTRRMGQGNAVVHIYEKHLTKLILAFPPIQEQQQIAGILSSVDDKLQVLSEKKVTYQELKQGLMQQLLTGKVRVKV